MYRPTVIADYFLSKYGRENSITPMKINKLVYIAHGWYLGITEKSLIDENPEAWKYGPVIVSLYYKYKNFGGESITEIPNDCTIKEDYVVFLDKIWEVYGGDTDIEIGAKVNQEYSPWSMVWNRAVNSRSDCPSLQITKSRLKNHYRELYLKNLREKTIGI